MNALAVDIESAPPAEASAWLDPARIELIRRNFRRIAPQAELFAEEFYGRLFALMPDARGLFHGDLREQGAKLTRMLAVLVSRLETPVLLEAPLAQLGQRHKAYGVTAADFAPVAEALLATLAHRLGDDFDATAREAWTTVYLRAAAAMQAPAAPAP
jgi:hemoglobin-like flavoprotein